MWQQIKAIREKRGEILTDMRSILTTAEARPEAERDLTAEERGNFDRLNTEAEKLKSRAEDLQRAYDLESDLRSDADPRRGEIDNAEQRDGEDSAEQREERRAKDFDLFLRHGTIRAGLEQRNVVTTGMGVVGPRAFSTKLIDSMKYFAGVREAGCQTFPTSDGNQLTVPTGDDTGNTGRVVAEAAANTNVTEPTLGVVQFAAYGVQSDWVKVSREMLQDAAFDVVGYIGKILAQRLGRKSNTLYTVGTNSSQPQGFATASTGATVGKTLASTTAITYDEWIDFTHSVDRAYRKNPSTAFQFHDTTLAALRKLKDGDSRYIWLAGQAGEPDQISGYRYVVNNDMDTPAAAKNIAAFGDWEAGYGVRDVANIEIVRANELFIQNSLIGFNAWLRTDGKILDTKAIRLLATAAS